ncbi:hypothetical protein SAMN04487958_107164 [Vreelandella subterranea]|uniref:Uncharacterized protein n=1 Tax=Vreelandella subterranea TaxID=416874 RepID=A0A1H9UR60_9GAMM|nr:hypothetical protein [Halomonas subterranea]SES11821.1 hypothetical protein SAMN04487958_107164 [Halomonas subterranea]
MSIQPNASQQLPGDMRLMIHAIHELALDVALHGRYHTYTTLSGERDYFGWRIVTMPAGKTHTDPEAVAMNCNLSAITVPGWGGMTDAEEGREYCREQLGAMYKHLESLLQDSQGGDA